MTWDGEQPSPLFWKKVGPTNGTNGGFGKLITMQPGETVIVNQQWDNIPVLTVVDTGEAQHYCIIARVESVNDPDTYYSDPGDYARENNNIAWKNVTIVNAAGRHRLGWVNPNPTTTATVKFKFTMAEEEMNNSFLDFGTINIDLGKTLFDKWVAGGSVGSGVVVANDEIKVDKIPTPVIEIDPPPVVLPTKLSNIQITGPDAWIGNIQLDPAEKGEFIVKFRYTDVPEANDRQKFTFRISQHALSGSTYNLQGGETYNITIPECIFPEPIVNVQKAGNVATLTVTVPNELDVAGFQWQLDDVPVPNATLPVLITQVPGDYGVIVTYQRAGCVSESNVETVEFAPLFRTGRDAEPELIPESKFDLGIFPNPAKDKLSIRFSLPESDALSMEITDINGRTVSELVRDKRHEKGMHETEINTTEFENGVYFLRVSTTRFNSTQKLIILK